MKKKESVKEYAMIDFLGNAKSKPTFMSGTYTNNPNSYTAPECLPQAAMSCGRNSNDPNCINSALKYLKENKYC